MILPESNLLSAAPHPRLATPTSADVVGGFDEAWSRFEDAEGEDLAENLLGLGEPANRDSTNSSEVGSPDSRDSVSGFVPEIVASPPAETSNLQPKAEVVRNVVKDVETRVSDPPAVPSSNTIQLVRKNQIAPTHSENAAQLGPRDVSLPSSANAEDSAQARPVHERFAQTRGPQQMGEQDRVSRHVAKHVATIESAISQGATPGTEGLKSVTTSPVASDVTSVPLSSDTLSIHVGRNLTTNRESPSKVSPIKNVAIETPDVPRPEAHIAAAVSQGQPVNNGPSNVQALVTPLKSETPTLPIATLQAEPSTAAIRPRPENPVVSPSISQATKTAPAVQQSGIKPEGLIDEMENPIQLESPVGQVPASPTPNTAPVANQPTLVAQATSVAQQIAVSMSQAQSKATEITLNPEELGRVRISLTTTEAGMAISIISERPETTDLMRRHLDLLASEFAELGYDDLSFMFDNPHSEDRDEPMQNGAMTEDVERPVVAAEQNPTTTRNRSGGLDLKL